VPQLFKGKQKVDFCMTERHHTPPMKLQHSRIESCPSDGSTERVHFAASPISGSNPSRLGAFLKDKLFLPPLVVTLNNLKDHMGRDKQQLHQLNSLYCSMCGTQANIVLVRAGQEMEHIFNLHRVLEKR
jgi:hypothetical protein